MSSAARTESPGAPHPAERLLIVGDGPVARALATALARSEPVPLRWWRRLGPPRPSADLVVLAVRDDAIGEVAQQIMADADDGRPAPILLHCSGARSAEAAFAGLSRRPRGVGVMHPLRALAGADDDATLDGVVFAVEGEAPAQQAALRLVARLGGTPLLLEAAQLPGYHAAAVLVANHAVGLVDAGVELLVDVGLDRADATDALAGLLMSTARNLVKVGLPDALTGPIARGDVDGVARHLDALCAHPQVGALYRATARRVTKVAAEKGRAAPEALARIDALLDGD